MLIEYSHFYIQSQSWELIEMNSINILSQPILFIYLLVFFSQHFVTLVGKALCLISECKRAFGKRLIAGSD